MSPLTRADAVHLLRGIEWLLFSMGGVAFWFGGGAIHAVLPRAGRSFAEIEGMALAVAFIGLGAIAKGAADRLEMGDVDANGPKSLGEAIRK